MALAVGLHAHGGTQAHLQLLLIDPTSPIGANYQAHSAAWRHREVQRL